MGKQPKGPLALGILTIAVGVGWFLTVRGYTPGVNWVWTLGLLAMGLLTFVVSGGVDKVSVLIGPFFLASSLLSLARQSGYLEPRVEAPVLVTLVGALLLVAQMRFIPLPKWLGPLSNDSDGHE